jgi:UrcA family protein
MLTRTLSALAAVALTGATLTVGSPAFAQEQDSVRVGYSDLDLSTPQGSERLDRRLRQAAADVCGTYSADLRQNQSVGECQARALSGARAEAQVALAGKAGGSRTVALRTD